MTMHSRPPPPEQPPEDTKPAGNDPPIDFVIQIAKVHRYDTEIKGGTYRLQHHLGGEEISWT